MQYRYRVVGKVLQPFILRGAYFIKGRTIEFCITDSELEFVKERCDIENIVDFASETDNSVSESKRTKKAVKDNPPKPQTTSKRQYVRRENVSNK